MTAGERLEGFAYVLVLLLGAALYGWWLFREDKPLWFLPGLGALILGVGLLIPNLAVMLVGIALAFSGVLADRLT